MGLMIFDADFLAQATALITQAKHEICISTFKLEINVRPRGRKLKSFFDLLQDKIKTGVKTRILFNWHTDKRCVPRSNYPASLTLKTAGADIRHLKNNRCCHAKILIVDKKSAIIGSHNLSVRSVSNNFEVSYLVPDPESVNQLSEAFDRTFYAAQQI